MQQSMNPRYTMSKYNPTHLISLGSYSLMSRLTQHGLVTWLSKHDNLVCRHKRNSFFRQKITNLHLRRKQ